MFSIAPLSTSGQRATRKEGRRTFLRSPSPDDWRAWAELRAKSREFLVPWEPSWPRDALTRSLYRRRMRQYADEWRQGIGYSFFLFSRDEEALLGGLSLSNVRRGVAQAANLGYWIGLPHANKGYMSEGIGVALAFAFEDLGLHRVEAACLPHNGPSKAVLARNGFQEEGYAKGYLKIDGAWRDHLLFAINRDDWKVLRRLRR
jgi:ribosomal-protein-alanine N-acetyltransferase